MEIIKVYKNEKKIIEKYIKMVKVVLAINFFYIIYIYIFESICFYKI